MSKARKMKKAGASASIETPVQTTRDSHALHGEGEHCLHCGATEQVGKCVGPPFGWVDAETMRIEFEVLTIELMDRTLSWPQLAPLPHIYEDLVAERGFDPLADVRPHVQRKPGQRWLDSARRLGHVVRG